MPTPFLYEPVYLGIVRRTYMVVVRLGDEKAIRRHFFDPELGCSMEGETRILSAFDAFDAIDFAGVVFVTSREGLEAYRPPRDATVARVILGTTHNPSGTTIEPFVAEWLFRQRARLERNGLLTAYAWCTHCGQLFEDQRTEHGYVTQIARWCSSCRRTRRRHLPQWRACAAEDCSVVFAPTRANRLYCSNPCRTAENERRALRR